MHEAAILGPCGDVGPVLRVLLHKEVGHPMGFPVL